MITPIRTMKISEIMERKDDLLVSSDDVKEIARNERAKTIEEFAKALKKKYPLTECNFGVINETLHKNIDEVAKELKGE